VIIVGSDVTKGGKISFPKFVEISPRHQQSGAKHAAS